MAFVRALARMRCGSLSLGPGGDDIWTDLLFHLRRLSGFKTQRQHEYYGYLILLVIIRISGSGGRIRATVQK
jgi:hypothetical protein